LAELTFYGGVNEIGGNKILISEKKTGIFLDFGQNFEKENNYFRYPYLQPREEKHLLALSILPPMPGIYKSDPQANTLIQAILVSHGHTDHANYVRYLKSDIPLYCSGSTREILISRDLSSPAGHSSEYAIAKLTQSGGEEHFYEINSFDEMKPQKIGDLEVTSIATDHSINGSCAFFVKGSDFSLVYTGDLRFHGSNKAASEKFVEEASKMKPDALIIEGTNIVSARPSTEKNVYAEALNLVANTQKLVLVSFSLADFDRLNTFYQIAKKTERMLVIPIKLAFMIDRMSHITKPVDLGDPAVHIYCREKKRAYEWEKQILEKYSNTKSCFDVQKEQAKMLMVASFNDMNEMCEIKPETGSIFIESQSEPFNEEMEIDHDKLLNWMENYGLPLYNIHCSGHAFPHQLKDTINKISPKKVFLVHTERPQLYAHYVKDLETEIYTPLLGQKYKLP
jgi:ribonuclease J